MSLTSKIPNAAMPVVRVLRRDVERPEELPTPQRRDMDLRWMDSKYFSGQYFCCPMGLHPKSVSPVPESKETFAGGICSESAVRTFYRWWDAQTDARAAVNALWPREEQSDSMSERARELVTRLHGGINREMAKADGWLDAFDYEAALALPILTDAFNLGTGGASLNAVALVRGIQLKGYPRTGAAAIKEVERGLKELADLIEKETQADAIAAIERRVSEAQAKGRDLWIDWMQKNLPQKPGGYPPFPQAEAAGKEGK